jgi:hypothetical protein
MKNVTEQRKSHEDLKVRLQQIQNQRYGVRK